MKAEATPLEPKEIGENLDATGFLAWTDPQVQQGCMDIKDHPELKYDHLVPGPRLDIFK